MSSSTTTMTPTDKPLEQTLEDAVNPEKTAKFLANLKRTIAKPDPDDTAAPSEAVRREVAAEVPKPKPAKREKKPAAKGESLSMQINLDPGTATKVVYIRVDKTLADRLQLIAFQNKINGNEGPSTINDIGIEALEHWLDTQAA